MKFNDWLRGRNRGGSDEPEYYEDTHDEKGNYTGKKTQNNDDESKKVNYGNIVVYRPSSPEEVEMLISFLKKGEPAVANLNDLEDKASQRILDFLSGAIFALDGSIHRITSNIFLLSPKGVEIQSYYDKE